MKNRQWYSIDAKHEVPEILIYDVIGQDFWGDGVSAKTFIEDLRDIKATDINVRINSPGGDVFEGNAIYNALRSHSAKIHIQIDSVAASIASVIAMAGDTVSMAENSLLMIHKPWTGALGNATELRKTADVLDKAEAALSSSYTNKSGIDSDVLSEMLEAETWLDASEAKELGLIDEILEPVKMAACGNYMLMGFKNVPDILKPEASTNGKKILFARERRFLELASIDADSST